MEEQFNIIKLDAIGSTNDYLKDLSGKNSLDDLTVVVTGHQSTGRGLRGAIWQSEKGKNLTFSILKYFDAFTIEHAFDLNMVVSLALRDVLLRHNVPNVSVKWPNDILSGNSKICGILIENVLTVKAIQRSIIGIGLNVNQTKFTNLERAASLKTVSGKTFDLDGLLLEILFKIKENLENYEHVPRNELFKKYEEALFRKEKVSTFKTENNISFNGIIKGVTKEGRLKVQREDDSMTEFGFKEVILLY
ncbi:biotin--[acetyl-CoA-carboxylase] ligase [Allomuricauda sp. d1]|uniref:biotin--[acetyl-CoA-carboxylase] ligase n=1 Tax=Allomuricauda sp. d1 TaxID=3136725 RepID=UPI0031DB34BF